MDYVDKTVAQNPSFAESYVAGQTVEGRDLKVIVLNPIKTSTRSLWIGTIFFLVFGIKK